MTEAFEELLDVGLSADVEGWDFSWLDGRATEERPPWGYARLLAGKLAAASVSLDLQTGGGEVLAEAPAFPPLALATESWPPNIARARQRLTPRGVSVVAAAEGSTLPFRDCAFDLVTSRHPASIWWDEIARVLRPGGEYFAQHVGPRSAFELIEFFVGPLSDESKHRRDPEVEAAAAEAAGLEIVDLRTARLRMEVRDVAAVVYLLRKVVWWVPDFSVERYRDRLHDFHEVIQARGPFVAHSTRHLIHGRRR